MAVNDSDELLATVFPGSGEMATRLRSIDWAKTPLGPVAGWSPTLRTMARFVLANRFPILLWWGPEYVQLYNDAYIPIPGTKHPRAAGQRGRECWSEIWHVIGPLVDTPFRGGPATWVEDLELEIYRHGFTEETHFTVAYSAVPDDAAPGGIGGVLATVHEFTRQVVQERRVVALRDLGTRAADAKTAEDACRRAAEAFGRHARDIPFALVYLLDEETAQARLAAMAGAQPTPGTAPLTIVLGAEDGTTWPLGDVYRTEAPLLVDDIARWCDPVPRGPWGDRPDKAVVLPIPSNVAHRLAGFLVLGVSARLAFDGLYESFFELATAQVATAIANARAFQEERRRAEALAELDRAKTTFFSNVSHEFRTPLTLMLGPLEEALHAADLPHAHRETLHVAHRNSLRLLRLVNTLLDFSRMEAGRAEVVFEEVDIAQLTNDLASVFRSAVERAGLSLGVRCERPAAPVLVDRDMWEKVVLNLLSNAFKFTFEGGITVSLVDAGDVVELAVEDTGVGIPQAELPHVFERFHRVRGSEGRTHEGTGIGLALVAELVKLHGGTVGVTSDLGRGSRFTVRIPTGAAHLPADRIGGTRTRPSTAVGAAPFVEEAMRWLPAIEASASAIAADHHATIVTTGGAHVLVADDNADMRAYLVRLLSAYWTVDAAVDGEAALAAAQRQRPDLVLSDVMMPRLDGIGLVRGIRADPALAGIPVILLSARAGEEARVEGVQSGADDYLTKPFSARELVARVNAHLALARARRDAEADLRNRELLFRTLVSASSQSVWHYRPGGLPIREIHEGNRAWWCQFTGQTEAERAARGGTGWLDVVHPEDREIARRSWSDLIANQGATDAEFRVRRHDGVWRRLRVRGTPFLTDGDVRERVGTVVDVTEQRAAEEALRQSQAETAADYAALSALYALAQECARAETTLGTGLEKTLRTAIALSGADRGTLQLHDHRSDTLRLVAHVGFPPRFVDFFATVGRDDASACGTALRTGVGVAVYDVSDSPLFAGRPSLAVLRDAGVRAVQSMPLTNGRGELLGMISTHHGAPHRPSDRECRVMELLARQAADFIERRRADDALRHHGEQTAMLLKAAPVGVYLVDADFRIAEVNPVARAMLGDGPDLVGRDFADVARARWQPDRADEIVRIFRHTLRTGEPYDAPERADYRIDRAALEHAEWRLDRITLPDGRHGLVCYLRDVGQQVEARRRIVASEESARRAQRDAETANRAKDDFLATVSHELRSPLQGILGWLTLLKRGQLDPTQTTRALESVERSVRLQAQLVHDIMDISRIVAGKVELERTPLDLAALLTATLEEFVPGAVSKGIDLDLHAERCGLVVGDRERLHQVVANLLTNALKFTPAGGRVRLSCTREDDTIVVRVQDTGQGIAPEFLPRLFDRFTQADTSSTRRFGGLGIGLAIVRHLVELHDGSVSAHSEGVGRGATFTVRLPRALRDADTSEANLPDLDLSAPRLDGVEILVVEDDRDALDAMTLALQASGATVRPASSAAEAWSAFERQAPDLVISDLSMPEEDGYSLLRRIRTAARAPSVPAIALTGFTRPEDKVRALSAGFAAHVPKPIDPDVLVRVLAGVLAGSEASYGSGCA